MLTYRSLLLTLLFIPFVSFAQPWQNNNVALKKMLLKEDGITPFIIKYYQPKLKNVQAQVPNATLKKDTVDNQIEFSYSEKWGDDFPDARHYLFLRNIPLPKDFIKGDLNADGIDDIVVSVYAKDGGRVDWADIFLFIGAKQGYKFYEIYDSYKLGFCKNTNSKSGKFYAASIKNGLFIGNTNCFAQGDPGCCPSLECETAFKFVKGKFVVASQKLTADRSPKN